MGGASAAADVTRNEFTREDGLHALDERVAVAVADVALQQRLVARDQRIFELQTIAADAAHRKLEVGQGTELDADSADLDLAAARVALEQAQGALAQARARLARLLGRDSGANLFVADPVEPLPSLGKPDFDALVDGDPRVQAARAEVRAASLERKAYERLIAPTPIFGITTGYERRDIPAGSFAGSPLASGLTALWPDRTLGFTVSIPVPLFDRQQAPRAQATARLLTAEAKLRTARAAVRSELESAWEALGAAERAAQAVAGMPALLARDADFIEQAVRAGAFDAVTRTQQLRRLADAGRLVDTTIRDYRAARAAWVRQSGQ